MASQCNNPQCAKRIRALEEELTRARSVGYDMLKQRGNWQAGGMKPQELGLDYDSMFTHEVEEVSEVLTRDSEMTESESRQLLSTAFQDVYETCKDSILNRMRDALSRVLVLPDEQEDDEQLYDIARAYGLLVNVCGNVGTAEHKLCSAKACSKLPLPNAALSGGLKDLLDEMSQLSWKLLEMVPPLVSETIYDTPFCKEWHAKEVEPEWKKDLVDYRLVYYRPILFFSYEGKVSQKGWVGNATRSIRGNVTPQQATAKADNDDGNHDGDVKFKQYRKPRLKVQHVAEHVTADELAPDEQTHFTVPDATAMSEQEDYKEPSSDDDTNSCYFGLRPL